MHKKKKKKQEEEKNQQGRKKKKKANLVTSDRTVAWEMLLPRIITLLYAHQTPWIFQG